MNQQTEMKNEEAPRPINLLGIIGLIASLLGYVISPFWIVGFICSILGIAKAPRWPAIAGIVISLAGAAIVIVAMALGVRIL